MVGKKPRRIKLKINDKNSFQENKKQPRKTLKIRAKNSGEKLIQKN